MAGRIVRLEQCVVDKIAAGEVVHRPASALKELLENSLDAGAKHITVVAGQGGMKMLQITDDGSGIRREDLDIVCERFTTSKLRKYEDLQEIASYGFRGEALSSVSHVAHVTITSKTKDQPCAYRAHYRDGELVSTLPGGSKDPIPCAGKTGTQILVEDMFYNLSTRKQALKNFSEQYHRVLDVMQRYAIHYGGTGTSFVCKKHRETTCDLNISSSSSTQLDVIKSIFGSSLAAELVAYSLTSQQATVNVTGYVTNANYNTKKSTFIVFINNRLVECPALRRACEYTYAHYLPKHTHPFVYLALAIPPSHVDVNVHPTKREVHFLHEEAVVDAIASHLNTLLQGGNQSRTFTVQPIAAIMASHLSAREKTAVTSLSDKDDDDDDEEDDADADTPQKKKQRTTLTTLVQLDLSKSKAKASQPTKAPQRLVRTDHTTTTMDKYLLLQSQESGGDNEDDIALDVDPMEGVDLDSNDEELDPKNLTSVVTLLRRVTSSADRGLTKVFREHTFVGVVNDLSSVIQHQTKLFLVNHLVVTEMLMYQTLLRQFGSVPTIPLHGRLVVSELALCALTGADGPSSFHDEATGGDDDRRAQAADVASLLVDKGPMLAEYFGLHINAEVIHLYELPHQSCTRAT
ncbi:hypothetical protein, variant 4 [Aphanomyces astaci]|uniref:DNA mismatch repair protein S5 domain-containing protein n=1 Tax=Aphanomyces astaci TaxID=112090 RepID=W4HCI5_APHAT|nr:hypothetical protein, variant 3 [Aphanomyces astaci]XP_009821238.1 hypothetical protein, variant 4 [Aphanomyces astaci]ETV88837.1 hypothetical protein, variant 3 [Aphanomyces astaci]ETV88838.1 hypothetical protein, variant 4 [Aphanomyces astaci]|eukprot:XP_009821237.1 hypothetical protein, variant 3 [Aphanomyces astaci]